ncbi:MAG: phosphatidylglycerol lysyltransferase domain-containing protein [Clostridiales bacterium]|nr:phosphatidylglycerol lysyltransferase domain-containing protein [Clostridiales bacterium]
MEITPLPITTSAPIEPPPPVHLFSGRITLEDRALLESFLNGFDYKASGLTYTSLFMWQSINHFRWEQIGEYLCLTGSDNLYFNGDNPFMFVPLTRTGEYDPKSLRQTILDAREIFASNKSPFSMRLVPFHMLEILEKAMPGELTFEADRPNFDYLYDTKDLIELKGRAYHSKKNHLNYFQRNHSYEYSEMTSDMADDVMAFIHAFNERKDLQNPREREQLKYEETAIHDAILNLDNIGYLSGCIRIDGKIEAISIGGRIGTRTVVVHIEKANTEYRGLYQAINNEFCKAMASNVKRINREEDMGIPGLRKAKLSYNPVKFVEKYTVMLK